MSTIPKEIQKKIDERFPDNMFGNSIFLRRCAEYGYQLATDGREELEKALDAAIAVIKQWHQADEVWDIYYNNAPEMKPIREARPLLKKQP